MQSIVTQAKRMGEDVPAKKKYREGHPKSEATPPDILRAGVKGKWWIQRIALTPLFLYVVSLSTIRENSIILAGGLPPFRLSSRMREDSILISSIMLSREVSLGLQISQ